MKKVVLILFVLLSVLHLNAQNPTGKKYIPWLQVDDVEVGQYFIWHGDTIDFDEVLSGVTLSDSTVAFVTPAQLMDSIETLVGGHDPVVLDGSAVLGGLSINGQLLGFTKASSTTNGYISATDYTTFNQKLSFITHDATLLGNGQSAFPLRVDSTKFVTPYSLSLQDYLTTTGNFTGTWNGQSASYYLDWNNFTNKPVISDDVYGISWDGNLDAASKNTIYDAIQAALNSNVDSVYALPDNAFPIEHLWYDVDGTPSFITTIAKPDGIIQGGYVLWTGSLNFTVSPAAYFLSGDYYATSTSAISLSAADPTNGRIDVIAVNDQSQVIVIEGTPAANPQKPSIDPSTQRELTYVLVKAGDTTPSNPNTGTSVTTQMVYDENVEWTGSYLSVNGTVNFASTGTPIVSGIYMVNATNMWHDDKIVFTDSESNTILDYTTLSLFIRLKTILSTQYTFYISLYSGTTAVSNEIKLPVDLVVTDWQNTSVSISDFSLIGTSFDKVVIRLTKRGLNTIISGFYLDRISLQGNLTQPDTGTGGDITGNETAFDGWDKDVSDDFDGDYNNLTNKPTIPTNNNQLTNGAGYITGYTETDPIYSAWDKSTGITITESQISDLQSYLSTETDPVFAASLAADITEADTTRWGAGGTEADPVFSAWDKDYNDLINTPTIPTALSQLTDDATHRLVTDTEKATWNGKLNSEVDGSITNELQTIDVAQLTGTLLELSLSSDGEATKQINLSALQDGTGTDSQTLSWSGVTGEIAISNGNTVDLDGRYLQSEVDGSVTNELQTISTSGAAGNITLSNSGGTLNLNVNDADASSTNEIQSLSFTLPNLSISSGNSVDLSGLQDGTGTDDQTAAEVSVVVQNGIEQNNVQAELEAIRSDIATSGDGWGSDVVNHNTTLSGDGTSGSPLGVNNITAAQVSDFDTEVANNTAVVANTAKVSNVTHTGEVVGNTALTVSDNVIDHGNVASTLKGAVTDNDGAWDFSAAGIINAAFSTNTTVTFSNLKLRKDIWIKLTITSSATVSWPAYCDVDGDAIDADATYRIYVACWNATASSEDVHVSITKIQ